MIKFDVIGDKETAAQFRQAGGRLRQEVDAEVRIQAERIRAFIVTQLLSGQMLKIRQKGDKNLRSQMVFTVRRGEGGILADIHPKPNSPLWVLGSGFKRKTITVTRRASRKQKRIGSKGQRVSRRYRRALIRALVGTYTRSHAIRKVPFMEMAYQQFKDDSAAAIKKAVERGAQKVMDSFGDAGGI